MQQARQYAPDLAPGECGVCFKAFEPRMPFAGAGHNGLRLKLPWFSTWFCGAHLTFWTGVGQMILFGVGLVLLYQTLLKHWTPYRVQSGAELNQPVNILSYCIQPDQM